MGVKERQVLKKRVLQYHFTIANNIKVNTIHHFVKEGVPRRTCYNILASQRTCDLPRSGRPVKTATPSVIRRIHRLFNNKDAISTRDAAATLQMSQSYLRQIKNKTLGIKSYRKQKAPKYKEGQQVRAESGSRYLYRRIKRMSGDTIIIVDDESYFPADPSQISGVQYYHTADKSSTPRQLAIKGVEKYPEKYLVWQAISSDGLRSEPFITKGQAMNASIYLKCCINERLIPFIDQNYGRDKVLFWPDLAPAHYQKDVIAALRQNGINVVPKQKNPPNVPQARPIERYWCLVKAEYKRRKKPARGLTSFKRMFKNDSAKVPKEIVLALMNHIPNLLRAIGYNSVYDYK